MRARKWAVIGGGFSGIVAAYHLASRGKAVRLIESSGSLGGIMNSVPWKGFFLDKGCHLFSNESDEATRIVLDILGRDYERVRVSYASAFKGELADGFAIPDLTPLGPAVARKILLEVVERCAATEEVEPANLVEALEARFGPTASRIFARMAKKMFQCPPEELSPEVLGFTPFQRIKFLDDGKGRVLKGSPALDERIAVSSQEDPLHFYRKKATDLPFRHFYPKRKGLAMFCEKAERKLKSMGVEIHKNCSVQALERSGRKVLLRVEGGEEISVDALTWTSGPVPLAEARGIPAVTSDYFHEVPMVVVYFVIKKSQESGYTYLQNYDVDQLHFRVSNPGGYVKSSSCPPGLSYICCEIPTRLGSAAWRSPEKAASRVWEEIKALGFVRGNKPVETLSVKIPKTFNPARVRHPELIGRLRESIGEDERIIWDRPECFSKNDIIASVNRSLEVG